MDDSDDFGIFGIIGVILILSTIILIIGFCVSRDIKKEEIKLSTMTVNQQLEYKYSIKKIEYEGHSYIIMSNNKYQNGICHDENCKCKITK